MSHTQSVTADLTREGTKVVIAPVTHESHGRVTRTTARAYLGLRDGSNDYVEGCEHSHGHKTVEAAKRCGVAMWKRLPQTA